MKRGMTEPKEKLHSITRNTIITITLTIWLWYEIQWRTNFQHLGGWTTETIWQPTTDWWEWQAHKSIYHVIYLLLFMKGKLL